MLSKTDPFYRRPLSDIEETILKYITDHPGMNHEEIASQFHNTEVAHMAIAYLCQQGIVYQDLRTQAIYADNPRLAANANPL